MKNAYNSLNLASVLAKLLQTSFDHTPSLVQDTGDQIDKAIQQASREFGWEDEASTILSQMVSDLSSEKESLQYSLDMARQRRDFLEQERDRLQAKVDELLAGEITGNDLDLFDRCCIKLSGQEKEKISSLGDSHAVYERYTQIIKLIRQGRKIDAIRVLREISGCHLVPAKEIVEEFVRKEDGDLL